MEELMKQAKNTMKLGIGTSVGSFAMGAVGGVSGMPAQAKIGLGTAQTGLGLLNVGQLAKTGMSIMPKTKETTGKHKSSVVNNILGL